MLLFLAGLLILGVGYLVYGKIVERIVGPDDRPVPAVTEADGVDYVVMPHWKNMMIQFLDIAGVGPVIGVIIGIKFGVAAFIIIPIGNIIGGAVHDFVSGMMSIRRRGANLPELIRVNCGNTFGNIFIAFATILLLLVVAVFVTTPAQLLDGFWKGNDIFWYGAAAIFLYYVIATLFPVDKIIGRFYPLFGILLVAGTLFLLVKLMIDAGANPELLEESEAFRERMFTPEKNKPIFPLLFVTIACGILSGFHATQSPIIARTMRSEREARSDFYGMMVLEGVVAMIWAAAALAIYNLYPAMMADKPAKVLFSLCEHFLGSGLGAVVVISVIILSITSGDTAMRSLRLTLAERFHVPQQRLGSRFLITLPLMVISLGLIWWSQQSAESFNNLWNYFAWGNQVLAACTFAAATIWLTEQKKNSLITMIPGAFITFIVICYILWISPAHGGPVGFGLNLNIARIVAAILSLGITAWSFVRGLNRREVK